VDGVWVEPDLCKLNANGEFDNLYLDMNGIIHPACHPEDQAIPLCEEDMFLAIFKYIDRIFGIVRPRKVLFMAIDGVAPRAKLNQQRARRFKSAKEMAETRRTEMDKYEAKCYRAKPDQMPTPPKFWDHNVITPGTPFMHTLSQYLLYYIHDRLSNHPAWKDVAVVLSDASVPGEGEHKIMEFVRAQRRRPDYDPNTRHAIHGKDADLIMLCLATHEPHFTIVRELDARRGAAKPRRGPAAAAAAQYHRAAAAAADAALARPGVAGLCGPAISRPPLNLLRVSILREYLARDLSPSLFSFPHSPERAIDDFVLLCFFAGNDFLPPVPALDIHEVG
jgi:5'-3' exoribonuclease 2